MRKRSRSSTSRSCWSVHAPRRTPRRRSYRKRRRPARAKGPRRTRKALMPSRSGRLGAGARIAVERNASTGRASPTMSGMRTTAAAPHGGRRAHREGPVAPEAAVSRPTRCEPGRGLTAAVAPPAVPRDRPWPQSTPPKRAHRPGGIEGCSHPAPPRQGIPRRDGRAGRGAPVRGGPLTTEVGPQQRRGLIREDAAVDVGAVVQARVADHVPQ